MSEWDDRQQNWLVIDALGNRVRIGDTVYDPQGKRFAKFYGITREPGGPSQGKVLLSPLSYGGQPVDSQELYPSTHGLRLVPAEVSA